MNATHQRLAVAVTTLILVCAGGAVAEPVTFTKDVALRSEARFNAAPVAQIRRGAVGDASAKQGPWLNIKTPEASGWALTTDVSFGSGGSAASSGGAPLGGLFGGGRQQASNTVTIGIRGFDKETIGNALGDGGAVSTVQLALLDGYAVSKDDGQSFAGAKGLSATSISY